MIVLYVFTNKTVAIKILYKMYFGEVIYNSVLEPKVQTTIEKSVNLILIFKYIILKYIKKYDSYSLE